MIPKFHAKGSSFKGAAQYVLHDKQADTNERVEWTCTVNLATDNPDAAWRVMAATALDQDRLKQQAGIPNTGRKSDKSVLHFTLSWHEEEQAELTPEEQMRAVSTILQVIKAEDRQALVVGHNDEPQPHVHVILNRVSPTDGRMLPSSFEKLKASRWAQKYEEERGKIYCHNRIINNAARDRGEYTRGAKDDSRHIHEIRQDFREGERSLNLIDEQRRRAFAIATRQRDQKLRHRSEWQTMEAQARELSVAREQAMKVTLFRDQKRVKEQFQDRWEESHRIRQSTLAEFERNETTVRGRVKNAFRLVQWNDLLDRSGGGQRTVTLKEAFHLLADAEARRQIVEDRLLAEENQLRRQQASREAEAAAQVRAESAAQDAIARRAYTVERSDMIFKHQMEKAKIKAEWREHGQWRRESWLRLKQDRREPPAPQIRISPPPDRPVPQIRVLPAPQSPPTVTINPPSNPPRLYFPPPPANDPNNIPRGNPEPRREQRYRDDDLRPR